MMTSFPKLFLSLFLLSSCVSSGVLAQNASELNPEELSVSSLIERLRSGTADEKTEAVVHLASFGPYAREAVEPLVGLLDSDHPALRYECLSALGRIGPIAHTAADSVTRFLSSDDILFQSAAIESLRRIGTASPEAEGILRRLCLDRDASVATSAVRCLVVIAGEYDESVRNAVPRLIAALSDERPEVRNEAAVTLTEIGPEVIPAVLGALTSDDRRTQVKVCEILGRNGSAAGAAVPALQSLLESDDIQLVRAAAAALGQIGTDAETVLPGLRKLLTHEAAAVRITAVRAIAEFGPDAAVVAADLRGLLTDQNAVLRASAADALGKCGSSEPQVIESLITALSDSSGPVTMRAADALSQLGPPAALALEPLLADARFRGLAVEILGEMGADAKPVVPALVRLLVSSEDPELQREVFIALASIGPHASAATPALLQILGNPESGDARAGAAYVLANVGETAAIPRLRELVKSADSVRVVRASAWALVTMDPDNEETVRLAMPHLLLAADSEVSLARREAVSAFSAIGRPAYEALPVLLKHAAGDPEAAVRAESLHALAEIRAPASQVLPVALASIGDPDPNVRNAARYLLGRLGSEAGNAAPQLRESLRRGSDFERVLSAWALVHVAPTPDHIRSATPLLVPALTHANPRVRAEVATTLGAIGGGSADVEAALRMILNDDDESVRAAASGALEKLGI